MSTRIVVPVAVVLGVVGLAFRTVPPAHVGVVDLFGRVGDVTLAPVSTRHSAVARDGTT